MNTASDGSISIRAWRYDNANGGTRWSAIITCYCGLEKWLPHVYDSELAAQCAASRYRDELLMCSLEHCQARWDIANKPSATAQVTVNPYTGLTWK